MIVKHQRMKIYWHKYFINYRYVGDVSIPGGRRDVTRRAAAGGICPYCGSEQVA
jgi:hypothetical protein